MNFEKIKFLQEELSHKIISKNILPKTIKKICAVDVSYFNNKAFCSAIVVDIISSKTIEIKNFSCSTKPYIPGFFMLREAKPILFTLKKLKNNFDLLLVDGHGRLHPRKCGLASFIGIKIDKPVIGVAKKLLCGTLESGFKIRFDGRILGYKIKNQKPLYVSTGHKIHLRTAKKIIESLILKDQKYPEPLRLADLESKRYRKSFFK